MLLLIKEKEYIKVRMLLKRLKMYEIINTLKEHLCWRCTSIIMGYVIGSIIQVGFLGGKSYFFFGSMLCTPCFVDYYLQQKGKLESTNFRRNLTRLLVGIGVSVLQ